MKSICGANCNECEMLKNKKCKGCLKTNGHPFEKKCFVANYLEIGGKESFEEFKKGLINEFNSLNIDNMPTITNLIPLNGTMINLEYPLPNGTKVKFLNDKETYLGYQVESILNHTERKRYFGLVANMSFILVCTYEENGINPEIICYKKR